MGFGSNVHDPCWWTLLQAIQQQICQQKVGQMVDGQRSLDAINRFAETCIQEPGVVEQDVDLRIALQQRRGERAHLLLGVQVRDKGVDSVASRLGFDLRDGEFAFPPRLRPWTATRAPWRANSDAEARPIPDVAPVTTQTRSFIAQRLQTRRRCRPTQRVIYGTTSIRAF